MKSPFQLKANIAGYRAMVEAKGRFGQGGKVSVETPIWGSMGIGIFYLHKIVDVYSR